MRHGRCVPWWIHLQYDTLVAWSYLILINDERWWRYVLHSRFSRSDLDAGSFLTKFPRQTATEVWRPHLSSCIFDPRCLFLEETASRHSSTWDPRLQRQSWLSYISYLSYEHLWRKEQAKTTGLFCLFGGWMQQLTWGVSSWFPWCRLQCEWYEGESTGTNQFLLKLSKTSHWHFCYLALDEAVLEPSTLRYDCIVILHHCHKTAFMT